MSVHFEENSIQVINAMNSIINTWLEEAAGELESQTKRNTPVDTGQLKASWRHKVDIDEKKATIGSSVENAIWNEFGTGQYALHGNGRKTSWVYKDVHGKWHRTHGKKPKRSLHNAFESNKSKLQNRLQDKLKGLGK